jgi:hypothetical protein
MNVNTTKEGYNFRGIEKVETIPEDELVVSTPGPLLQAARSLGGENGLFVSRRNPSIVPGLVVTEGAGRVTHSLKSP